MNINNSYDRHLDPPDDGAEVEYCEFCGQEMELCTKGYTHFTCVNPFCPDLFNEASEVSGRIVCEMSEHLVEVEQELADTKSDLKYANARITNLKTRITHLQTEIDDDREVIIKLEKLTLRQQGEE